MDWESLYCPNRRCRCYGYPFAQGQLAKNGSSHGQKQARCGACGTYVSIRYGTAYLDLHADSAIFETAVRALAEGNSIRAAARIVQVDKDTVCAWLDRAAQHCRLIMLYLWRDLPVLACLLLKLGLQVSPRTVRKYMPHHCIGGPGKRCPSQRWSTFIRNHAKGIVACDFCVAVTATFRVLYVFVIIEHASRRLLHVNVTAHPTAQWTIQQFREAIPADHTYRILIHDWDTIFSKAVEQSVSHMRLHVIKTPVRTPVANAICERVIGTLRRECLDFMIPLNDKHLYGILQEWVTHYNQGRPHMSLGPGIPKPIRPLPVSRQAHRHWLRSDQCIVSQPILNGLHQDYRLEKKAA